MKKSGKHYASDEKTCYCITCKKALHYLGVAMHRKAHERRKQDCTIRYTGGEKKTFQYSKKTK